MNEWMDAQIQKQPAKKAKSERTKKRKIARENTMKCEASACSIVYGAFFPYLFLVMKILWILQRIRAQREFRHLPNEWTSERVLEQNEAIDFQWSENSQNNCFRNFSPESILVLLLLPSPLHNTEAAKKIRNLAQLLLVYSIISDGNEGIGRGGDETKYSSIFVCFQLLLCVHIKIAYRSANRIQCGGDELTAKNVIASEKQVNVVHNG